MDVNFFLTLNQYIFIFFALVGFSFSSYILINCFRQAAHRLRFGRFMYTSQEKEIFLLKEQISLLNKSNAELELQLQEITQSLIKNLRDKL